MCRFRRSAFMQLSDHPSQACIFSDSLHRRACTRRGVELGFGFDHTPPARRVRRTIGFIIFIAEIIPNRYRYDSECKTYFRILQRGQEPSHNGTLSSVYRSPVYFRAGKLRQSARYLLIVAFLQGPTNPPPEGWFTRAETWNKETREKGTWVTVPQGAEQAVMFLAPETGGDFATLRSTV